VFTRAIVRPPGTTFEQGLTSGSFGPPHLPAALAQHEHYCEALERCGLEVIALDADARFPDSTFIEDTAIVTDRMAVLTRPGAPSRQGEVSSVAAILTEFYEEVQEIRAPGTIDGGDVCEAGDHFFIGLSARTNEAGANQLADVLAQHDFAATLVDIRRSRDLLHLKTGLSWLGDGRFVMHAELARRGEFAGYERIVVDPGEQYAANCIVVNEHVFVPEGFPRLADELTRQGFGVVPLAMSEFQKMDGGLSCLSLRF